MIATNLSTNNELSLSSSALATTDSAAANASDFQSFLTLLTAQLRNQDPLSPLDSTQFVEQLASFSAVEQQIETNSHLEAMANNFASSGLDGAVKWIGKEVEVESSDVYFEGDALTFRVPPGFAEQTIEAVVYDLSGNVVRRDPLRSGVESYIWNGETDEAIAAKNGRYSVDFLYYEGDTIRETKKPIAVTEVVEARLEEGKVQLALRNGGLVDPAEISVVRNVQAAKETEAQS